MREDWEIGTIDNLRKTMKELRALVKKQASPEREQLLSVLDDQPIAEVSPPLKKRN